MRNTCAFFFISIFIVNEHTTKTKQYCFTCQKNCHTYLEPFQKTCRIYLKKSCCIYNKTTKKYDIRKWRQVGLKNYEKSC